jgi:hypothetical protein
MAAKRSKTCAKKPKKATPHTTFFRVSHFRANRRTRYIIQTPRISESVIFAYAFTQYHILQEEQESQGEEEGL